MENPDCENAKKQKIVKMENPDLPQEILLEIFSRTLTYCVGQCRTLSKYWNFHLSSPDFIKKHLITRKRTIQQEHVSFTPYHYPYVRIVISPTKQDEFMEFINLPCQFFRTAGSCDGLILLLPLELFNPITREQVTIPFNHFNIEHFHLRVCEPVYGFGYDSCSDDYKIVELSCYESNRFVDVYSVKNGVWRSLDDGCYPYGELVPKTYAFEGGAFVNGALHWLICSKGGYRSCIAAFDLGYEVFSEVPLPEGFVRELDNDVSVSNKPSKRRSNGLSVVGGCLVIVDNHGKGLTDVWIMKEYRVEQSWVKFRIQSEDGDYKWKTIISILCYVEDDVLLCLTNGFDLFACDLKGGTVRRVVLGECDDMYASGMAFVDSLVSPEGPW